MAPSNRYATTPAKVRRPRRLNAPARLERERRQAQHAATVLAQALHDLDLPEDLVAEVEGR